MNSQFLISYRLEGQYQEFKAHSHQEYEIYLFHKGTCRYLISNQIYDLSPGDILIMDGLALHKPNLPKDSEYVRSHIHFSPTTIRPILDVMGATNLLDIFDHIHHCLIRSEHEQDIKQVEQIIKQMNEIINHATLSTLEKEWELKTLLIQVLIIINRLSQPSSQKTSKAKFSKMQHAENIATYIQKNYHNKISIDSISAELNISKSYVSRVFKEMTGYTIMEYVMATRLQQVKFLLEIEEDKTLQQLSDECGFESASHFSRFFKEHVGITAKEYQRRRLEIYKRSE
ncbi:AraC family transcriptional regulator [Gracilibacillus marinus]|uniref:AraC family transcriptional regulator n=1 Tax=Gracilibacillus marinus TaxID=630535 RepID=A0ABV8VZD3_9BACI